MTISATISALSIERATLWRDEMATREFSGLSFGNLIRATSHVDRSLAPYYLLIHLWRIFGSGAIALRMPSAIAGAVAVGLVAAVSGRIWGYLAGFVGGVALAVNPSFVAMAIEARPTALTLMLVACATWCLVALRESTADTDSRSVRTRWLLYAASMVLAVLLQPFAVLAFLGHLILVIGPRGSGMRLPMLRSAVPSVAVFVLVAATSRSQQAQISWIGKPGLRNSFHEIVGLTGQPIHAVFFWLVVFAAVLAQILSRRVDQMWLMSLALWMLPGTVLFVVSRTIRPILVDRYLITAQMGAAMMFAGGLAMLASLTLRTSLRSAMRGRAAASLGAAFVIVLLISAASPLRSVVASRSRADDYAGLATAVRTEMTAGQELYVSQSYSEGGFAAGIAYYSGDANFAALLANELPSGRPSEGYLRQILGGGTHYTTAQALTPRPSGIVWLVGLMGAQGIPQGYSALLRVPCTADRLPLSHDGDIALMQVHCSPN